MLLCRGNDLVCRGGLGSQAVNGCVIDDMRPGVIVAAAAVARDITRQNDQHPRRIIGQADEQPRLRQVRKLRNAS